MSLKAMIWATVIIVPIVFGLVMLMARFVSIPLGVSVVVACFASVLSLVKAIVYMRRAIARTDRE